MYGWNGVVSCLLSPEEEMMAGASSSSRLSPMRQEQSSSSADSSGEDQSASSQQWQRQESSDRTALWQECADRAGSSKAHTVKSAIAALKVFVFISIDDTSASQLIPAGQIDFRVNTTKAISFV
jgi:hypothetical protein